MATISESLSSLMFGLLGAALFKVLKKYIGSYINIHREISSVTKEIDEIVQEIRDSWR
jgi:hypothetical protein